MRQHVTPQELMELFTISPSEHELLGTKSGASRLGCAVLLKYFQCEGRFPTSWHDVPREVIRHLAQSFGVSPDAYRHYDLDDRLARYHKDQIRQGTGFRQGTTTDAETIKAGVCAQSRVDETMIPVLTDQLTERYKHLQIELAHAWATGAVGPFGRPNRGETVFCEARGCPYSRHPPDD